MTRIIGGDFRGRSIKVPDAETRPTSSRVREAIFSSVEHAVSGLDDLRVLDLFSGSGAFGIESISRGAAEAVLIEKDLRAADTLHTNVANFGIKNARVVIADAFTDVAQKSGRGTFDVVFIDPPYSFEDQDVDTLIANLVQNDWLNEYAVIVVERGSRSQVQWPESVEELRKKVYGDTSIWYGQYLTNEDPEDD
jgi:16S rRNA (guanine966-N2)-methyltransferase